MKWSASGSLPNWWGISWRGPAPRDSPSASCWSNCTNGRTVLKKRGDKTMFPNQMRLSSVGVTILVICVAAGAGATVLTNSEIPLIAGALLGLYFLFSIRIADQWERVAVLRFGKFTGLRGPGLFQMIPIVDRLSVYVDQRVRVANVSAESTLTRDTVPVNVDAIVFWMVWNAEKSILEVQDFTQAITLSAQTALRESIGRHELHQMVAEREMLGKELQRILDEKTTAWGITVQSVEIRDVQIPADLQDAMSREAQAERERRARTILGLAETEIADSFQKAALTYQDNPVALHLRAMNMLYEAIKERGSMVIVPSSAVETMGLGGNLALASLNGVKPEPA